MEQIPADTIARIKAELYELDKLPVQVDGVELKPSQCYRFSMDPVHVLFNTNCPDKVKQQVEAILSKYLPHEIGS